jgi:outer membrane protein TolC
LATTAPDSLGHSSAESVYAFQLNQEIRWCGKRAAKGRAAQADAKAAHGDLENARLELMERAENAFYDYYLVRRQLELNLEDETILRQFRDKAISKYRATKPISKMHCKRTSKSHS